MTEDKWMAAPEGAGDDPDTNGQATDAEPDSDELQSGVYVANMYEDWFLDYASYVILDRAVPYLDDGLKPVQRRILHSMRELDDGRYNKVANIIGNTMKYHPHGDAAIGDAIVNLGQKELLIDPQGNWGNIYTGDRAAAPRYIEARLTKFAREVVFSPKITDWQASYDGRNKEPIAFPVKFPLLLSQGVEGIAVGLSTKILPHNFVELIKESIRALEGKKPKIFPDFPTGGMADVSNYNDGARGSRVRVRAKIEIQDTKTLVIRDLPYGKTTQQLIDSILNANDKGKIKIKRVEDNTARNVEIMVYLPPGVSPDVSVDALYAFTDCEISLAPNCCVIVDDKPQFLGVGDLLTRTALRTKELLRLELEHKLGELEREWHYASLERIFISNRIYRDIEECETWEAVIEAIRVGLAPHIQHLKMEVTTDDITRLTEIKIKRISKFDLDKADENLKRIEEEIEQVKHHLANLTQYAIDWYKHLLDTYGKGHERLTELREFETVQAAKVAANNVKLYVNRAEGFVGTSLKKDELVAECSDIDDVIVFRANGTLTVTKVAAKTFIGEDIIHVAIWKRGDDRSIYHMIYRSGKSGPVYVKRFAVPSITRDREYDLTTGEKGSKVLYFTANPQGEGEIVSVQLSSSAKARKMAFDFDFSDLAIKGRGSRGNTLSKHAVRRVDQKERTGSTLAGIDIWFDEVTLRLNTEERGRYLGSYKGDDKILVIYNDGSYDLTSFDLSNQYQTNIVWIGKNDEDTVISAIYHDAERDDHYVKRFTPEPTKQGVRVTFIGDEDGNKLEFASADAHPRAELIYRKIKGKQPNNETIAVDETIDVKGLKALGNKLSRHPVRKITTLTSQEPVKTASETSDAKGGKNGSGSDGKADDDAQPGLFG